MNLFVLMFKLVYLSKYIVFIKNLFSSFYENTKKLYWESNESNRLSFLVLW